MLCLYKTFLNNSLRLVPKLKCYFLFVAGSVKLLFLFSVGGLFASYFMLVAGFLNIFVGGCFPNIFWFHIFNVGGWFLKISFRWQVS